MPSALESSPIVTLPDWLVSHLIRVGVTVGVRVGARIRVRVRVRFRVRVSFRKVGVALVEEFVDVVVVEIAVAVVVEERGRLLQRSRLH